MSSSDESVSHDPGATQSPEHPRSKRRRTTGREDEDEDITEPHLETLPSGPSQGALLPSLRLAAISSS